MDAVPRRARMVRSPPGARTSMTWGFLNSSARPGSAGKTHALTTREAGLIGSLRTLSAWSAAKPRATDFRRWSALVRAEAALVGSRALRSIRRPNPPAEGTVIPTVDRRKQNEMEHGVRDDDCD